MSATQESTACESSYKTYPSVAERTLRSVQQKLDAINKRCQFLAG